MRLAAALSAVLLTGSLAACTEDGPDRTADGPGTSQTPTLASNVTVEGAPAGLATLVSTVYAGGRPAATKDARKALARRTPTDGAVSAKAALGRWHGTRLAVVTVRRDVTLAVNDGGWKVVGGWWPSLGVKRPALGGVRHVVVIGSDARPGERPRRTRGDSLHVVGFDQRGGGGILGIPRDSYVPIPGAGLDKINAALMRGGPEAQTRAIADHTGLPVEGYLLTGFQGFTALVNAVGGLRMDYEAIPEIGIRGGLRTLRGGKALDYARDRYHQPDGDFGRSRNQGDMLKAGAAMARKAGPLGLPRLITLVAPHVYSDLSPAEVLTLAAHVFTVRPGRVPNKVAIGGFGTTRGGASIVVQGPSSFALYRDLRDGNLR